MVAEHGPCEQRETRAWQSAIEELELRKAADRRVAIWRNLALVGWGVALASFAIRMGWIG